MPQSNFSKSDLLTIINSSPVGMLLVDKKGIIKFSNHKAQAIFAYQENELFDLPIDSLIPIRHQASHIKKMQMFLDKPSPTAMAAGRVLPGLMKNGDETLVEIGLVPIKFNGHELILVSTIEASNTVLKVAVFHDPLTGLPNRNLFFELSNNLRNLAIRNKVKLTVLFLDLDCFKQVNDDYGHNAGDLVLIEVASILHKSIRNNDVAGRLGGDEFILCLYDSGDKASIELLTKKLNSAIANITEIHGHPINISASIGAVTTQNPDSIHLDEMIKQADRLMYKVKKSGKGKALSEEV